MLILSFPLLKEEKTWQSRQIKICGVQKFSIFNRYRKSNLKYKIINFDIDFDTCIRI